MASEKQVASNSQPMWLRRGSNLLNAGADFAHVPKNERGGVLVSEADLRAAFSFFDMDETGRVTLRNLRKRLGVFYPHMPMADYRLLMDQKDTLSLDDLRELVRSNEVKNFDPAAEAFKAYEPDSDGCISPEKLRSVFKDLGFGEMSDEDLDILTETADVDGDGRISLSDFRAILSPDKGAKKEEMHIPGLRPGFSVKQASRRSPTPSEVDRPAS